MTDSMTEEEEEEEEEEEYDADNQSTVPELDLMSQDDMVRATAFQMLLEHGDLDFIHPSVIDTTEGEGHSLSPTSLVPMISFLPPFPNLTPEVVGMLPPAIADALEDELDDLPPSSGIVFDNDPLARAMRINNVDFAQFCKQLWDYYHHDVPEMLQWHNPPPPTVPPPTISFEANLVDDWSTTRPDEITREDVARGSDIQGIPWDDLELDKDHARRYRRSRYINYRNIINFPKRENLVFPLYPPFA